MERYSTITVIMQLYHSWCDHMTNRFATVSYQLFTLMVAVILTAEHVRAIDTVPQLNISQYEGRWYQVCNIQYGNFILIACGYRCMEIPWLIISLREIVNV